MPIVQPKTKINVDKVKGTNKPTSPVKKVSSNTQPNKSNSTHNSPVKKQSAKPRVNTIGAVSGKFIARKIVDINKQPSKPSGNVEEIYSIIRAMDQKLLKLKHELDAKFDSLEQDYNNTFKIFEKLKTKQDLFCNKSLETIKIRPTNAVREIL